jgi:hypothetical protein
VRWESRLTRRYLGKGFAALSRYVPHFRAPPFRTLLPTSSWRLNDCNSNRARAEYILEPAALGDLLPPLGSTGPIEARRLFTGYR